jgi:TRAP-type C4-dicarboxylate transport system substrate-binding protein
VIGKRGLAKIPADLQQAFVQAAQEASVHQRTAAAVKGAEAIAALGKGGMTFFPMADAERESIRKVMREKLWVPFTQTNPSMAPVLAAIDAARG